MKRVMMLMALVLALGCSGNVNPAGSAPSSSPQSQMVTMPSYPSPDTWQHANERERNRAKRSFAELKKRHVPVFQGPLFVDDDVTIRSPQDVARRALVLWAVELRAEGVQQVEARQIVDRLKLWEFVSPKEKRFLDRANPSPDECKALVWRLEDLWVLMWALGYVEKLDWPRGMCDGKQLAEILGPREDDPTFISQAKLRDKETLIDAQDLTMRIHWAIRDAHLHQDGMIPEELDWSGQPEYIPVTLSAAAGVVEERHYVLNWLVDCLTYKNWDDVDTPT
jgi:hypothetical protein